MLNANKRVLSLIAFGFVLLNLTSQAHGALEVGFYNGKCRTSDVEAIVRKAVLTKFLKDPTITPALLRLQFHDCFVNGCDASILLDGSNTEKTAPPNLSVRGYDVIDAAKTALEQACPGVVSCADIIVMATRDAVSFSGGGRYMVETGRRDGVTSLAQDASILPGPSISVSNAIKGFANKGLTVTDMVYLLGGHTVGIAHCSLFKDRLYNFQNTGKPDPTMDLNLLATLRQRCPQNATVNNVANLDQNRFSSLTVDKSYFQQIGMRRGVLQIDQELALDPLTKSTVATIAAGSGFSFSTRFGQAMVNLGRTQVLTGTQGEIRQSCRAINPKPLNLLQDPRLNV